jgi:predicted transcriptional regulator
MSAKFRRKFEEKPEVKTKKGGYTEAEINNIIAMYNLGDSPKAIGKKIGKPASAISTKLWNLKREGRIEDRKKPELPPDESDPDDDGFKTL